MSGILGVKLPEGKVGATLAAVAVVSIPVALAVGAGFMLVRGGKRMRKRLWQESEDEMAARLEKTYREYPPDTV